MTKLRYIGVDAFQLLDFFVYPTLKPPVVIITGPTVREFSLLNQGGLMINTSASYDPSSTILGTNLSFIWSCRTGLFVDLCINSLGEQLFFNDSSLFYVPSLSLTPNFFILTENYCL